MALKPCHECGADVSTSAPTCPHCGAKQHVSVAGCGNGCLAAVVGLLIISGVSGLISTISEHREARRADELAEQRATRIESLEAQFTDSAEVILAEAREHFRSGRVEEARVRLAPYQTLSAPPELVALRDSVADVLRRARDVEREQALLDTLRNVPAEDAARNAALYGELVRIRPGNDTYRQRRDMYQGRVEAVLRRAFAERYETELLRAGMDVEVSTRGANATTLRLQYVLFSRVWAQRFSDDTAMWSRLRGLGFERLEMSDGYDFSWAWTINP